MWLEQAVPCCYCLAFSLNYTSFVVFGDVSEGDIGHNIREHIDQYIIALKTNAINTITLIYKLR